MLNDFEENDEACCLGWSMAWMFQPACRFSAGRASTAYPMGPECYLLGRRRSLQLKMKHVWFTPWWFQNASHICCFPSFGNRLISTGFKPPIRFMNMKRTEHFEGFLANLADIDRLQIYIGQDLLYMDLSMVTFHLLQVGPGFCFQHYD